MGKTAYYILDIHITHGTTVSRFYHRVGSNVFLRMGLLTSIPGYKHIRLPATKECYLSWLRTYDPYAYLRQTGKG